MNIERSSYPQSSTKPETVPSRRDNLPPPARVWLFATLFGLIFIGGFELVSTEVEIPSSQAFLNHNRARLSRFAALTANSPSQLKVVILGNSTIKYGTAIDEESFSFTGSDKIRVIRIVNNWANFSDFSPLTEQILNLRPDLIVMQTDLLGRVRLIEHFTKPAQLQRYLKWRAFGPGDWDPLNLNQAELQTDQVDYNDKSEQRFERRRKSLTEWQGIDLDGPDAKQANDFIESARQRGISIVLLYTPVTARVEPLEKTIQQHLSGAVNRQLEHEGVTLLEYPSEMDDSQFSDFVHMNERGREIYTKWLVPELLRIALESSRIETLQAP